MKCELHNMRSLRSVDKTRHMYMSALRPSSLNVQHLTLQAEIHNMVDFAAHHSWSHELINKDTTNPVRKVTAGSALRVLL